MAQPSWFRDEPETAWAFYGHRQQLYRETRPHDGYRILRDWGRVMPGEYFVVTSNVDGHFEAAGFGAERLLEVHGNVHVYQCAQACRQTTWRDSERQIDIDLETMRAHGRLPTCPDCGGMARPNVLMFGDGRWVPRVMHAQRGHYQQWLASVRGRRLVVVEVGAGKAIPTVRRIGEDLVAEGVATLVRINPEASEADELTITIRMGALEALTRIDEARAKIAGRSTRTQRCAPDLPRDRARSPERGCHRRCPLEKMERSSSKCWQHAPDDKRPDAAGRCADPRARTDRARRSWFVDEPDLVCGDRRREVDQGIRRGGAGAGGLERAGGGVFGF